MISLMIPAPIAATASVRDSPMLAPSLLSLDGVTTPPLLVLVLVLEPVLDELLL